MQGKIAALGEDSNPMFCSLGRLLCLLSYQVRYEVTQGNGKPQLYVI